jgi:uncharacterized Zn finger protein (UPF0148 family)
MEKVAVVRKTVTPCDVCGRPSNKITKDGKALCANCSRDDGRLFRRAKQSSADEFNFRQYMNNPDRFED